MPVRLRLLDLELLARAAGFESYRAMLYDLYIVQGFGLYEVGRRCHIHYTRVRRHLKRFGIPIHSRGGPNNVKVVVSPELLQEVIKDGVEPVAERLGITAQILRKKLAAAFPPKVP